MEELLGRHESDPANFDGAIEQNLRAVNRDIVLKANCPVSAKTRFNVDLIIEEDGSQVCLEIEKGQLSRFEFDILKMQAFASKWRLGRSEGEIFGAFLIPADNIVARHISGNARESSYQYLRRLFRLVVQIEPLLLDDILLVGYGSSVPQEKQMPKRQKDTKIKEASSGNLVFPETGLLSDETLRSTLASHTLDTVMQFRNLLSAKCVGLREKLNRNSRYLGYATGERSDGLYVYVQKKGLRFDLRVSGDRADELRHKGFDVRPVDNYQAKAGWLTGLAVPHDTDRLDEIVDLAVEALRG